MDVLLMQNQALKYSLTGDVILRHRNRNTNRPRDEHSLCCSTCEVVLYTRTIKRKLNLLVRSPTEDSNESNPYRNGLRRTRRREAQGCPAPRQCTPTKHLEMLMLMLIQFAGKIGKRTPKHELVRRHSHERQQGQHCRHHCWQERTHHWRHRRREDAHWWPRRCQRRHGLQQGCGGYRRRRS